MSVRILSMSKREFERAALMRQVHERKLTQAAAARLLGLSQRQTERLYQKYRTAGPGALVSRKRGQPSNRQIPDERRGAVLEIVRARYADFGPTLAREKLLECHGLCVSTETLRKWMTEDGLWVPHARRRDRIHQPRRRRACVGELIQIDGCDHDWFEERAARCVLLVYVDDATSQLMQIHFCEAESTFEYFEATRGYLERFGKPVAFYSDKATVFHVNAREPCGGDGVTQFGRAMSDINVDVICANSAPAKGRVERAHSTLQDRLVKELRLRGISSIGAANAFAAEFMTDYNARFAKKPQHELDAHRPLLRSEKLDDILCWQEPRKVSKSLTINYQRRLYLLKDSAETRALAGKHITMFELRDGSVQARVGSRCFPLTQFSKDEARISQGAIVSNKLLAGALQHIKQEQQNKDAEKLPRLRTTRDKQLLRKRAEVSL
jgi:hypothetical protein